MRQYITKPSPAMIVACLALFVGMSGASYAATKIGASQIKNNAVRSKHIKNGEVKGADVRANAINGVKVADSSLGGADVANESLTGDDIADGGIRGADVADGTISGTDVTNESIGTDDLAADSVNSAKVRDDSLTGTDIDESTLGQVPDSARVGGKTPSAFLSSSIYKVESAITAGQALGDGTFAAEKACNPGDVLLSGGPANIAATSVMVESFPAPGNLNAWKVRINKNAQNDSFNVVVLCSDQ